jgi:hypothetical protein
MNCRLSASVARSAGFVLSPFKQPDTGALLFAQMPDTHDPITLARHIVTRQGR